MKLNRVLLASGALMLSGTVFASFELALIPDGATKVVHRYDIDSGVYLGSFGQNRFISTIGAIAVNQAINAAYVVDGGTIRKFNYHTGEYLGARNTLLGVVRQINLTKDGRLILASGVLGANLTVMDFDTGVTSSIQNFSASSTPVTAVQNANNSYTQLFNDVSFFRIAYHPTQSSPPTSYVTGGTGTAVDMASRGDKISYVFSGGWFTWTTSPVNSFGMPYSLLSPTGAPAISAGHVVTGTAWGHEDPYAISTNGTVTQMGWFSQASGTMAVRTLPSQIQNGRDIAIVVAPEPGTMATLGLATVALLRRRRGASKKN